MLGLVFAAPFLLLLVVFALSNRSTVRLGMWPTDLSLDVPLSLAVLGAGAVFFVLGALVTWISTLSQRRRARRAESRVRLLERELEGAAPGAELPAGHDAADDRRLTGARPRPMPARVKICGITTPDAYEAAATAD